MPNNANGFRIVLPDDLRFPAMLYGRGKAQKITIEAHGDHVLEVFFEILPYDILKTPSCWDFV
jgi:hypothetical protein